MRIVNNGTPTVSTIILSLVFICLVLILLELLKQQVVINQFLQPTMFLGEEAPNFRLCSFSGEKLSLQDLQDKFVLLYFFSLTCPRCYDEVTLWYDFYREGGLPDKDSSSHPRDQS